MGMMIRRGKARAAKAAPVISYDVPEKKIDLVTRSEIEKMPYFGLKSVATKNGIEVAGKKTAELRALIIEKLNL